MHPVFGDSSLNTPLALFFSDWNVWVHVRNQTPYSHRRQRLDYGCTASWSVFLFWIGRSSSKLMVIVGEKGSMTVLSRGFCRFLLGSVVASGKPPVLRQFIGCKFPGAPVKVLDAPVD